ncbi:MAG: hypothetical protein MSG64_17200 [Pyrinomonadaceae bacterium MAG19_C2-C3]|nr:hypothetical protein [Pyrinomonadaceae bacterium MAG19_C2-C3]
MNEDTTRDLPAQSFEERVLAEFAALRQEVSGLRQEVGGLRQEVDIVKQDVHGMKLVINEMKQDIHGVKLVINEMSRNLHATNQRLTTLEEKVDERLRETRPMWEAVLVQLSEVKHGIALLNAKMLELIRDSMALRARVVILEEPDQSPFA